MEATRSKVATYLDVLAIYSDTEVETACRNMMRRNSAFPPSAGELRGECERVVTSTRPAPVSHDLNLPPPDKRTDEEKAASRARVAKMYEAWRAGLPPAERGLAKAVGGMLGASPAGQAGKGEVSLGPGLQAYFAAIAPAEPAAVSPLLADEDDDAPQF